MRLLRKLKLAQRLRAALALLLLVMGLGSALALQQARSQQQQLAWLAQTALPSVRLLQEMSGQVDELRGLLALHLMLGGGAQARETEQQMAARRQAITQRLAGFEQRLVDATERTHLDAVQHSLAGFDAEYEKLLAISRQGLGDAASAATARALLIGPSQWAYQRLCAALAAWSAYLEQRSDQTSRQARAAADGLALLLAAQAALMLGAALLLGGRLAWQLASPVWAGARQASAGSALFANAANPGSAAASISPRLDGAVPGLAAPTVSARRLAVEAQLLAINAAVAAARSGDPADQAGQTAPSDSDEGLRHLAQRVTDATLALRQLLAAEPAG